jgi:hypothetical protein
MLNLQHVFEAKIHGSFAPVEQRATLGRPDRLDICNNIAALLGVHRGQNTQVVNSTILKADTDQFFAFKEAIENLNELLFRCTHP